MKDFNGKEIQVGDIVFGPAYKGNSFHIVAKVNPKSISTIVYWDDTGRSSGPYVRMNPENYLIVPHENVREDIRTSLLLGYEG